MFIKVDILRRFATAAAMAGVEAKATGNISILG
jgi:hypothetical protein